MVGRLVEQEQIGLDEERTRELEATALTARQRFHVAHEIVVGEPEVGCERPGARLDGIAAVLGVARLELAVAGERALGVELGSERVELRADGEELGEREEQRIPDRALAGELLRLLEVGDAHTARPRDRAPVHLQGAVEEPQQRRFSRAVRPHEADPIARVHLQGEPRENLGAGVPEVDVTELYQHGSAPLAKRRVLGNAARRV